MRKLQLILVAVLLLPFTMLAQSPAQQPDDTPGTFSILGFDPNSAVLTARG